MGSKPKPPETPEYEKIQKENAAKNLEFANDLHDRNFEAMEAAIMRDNSSAAAGSNSADSAIKASRQQAYSGQPMALVSSEAASSIDADNASLTGDDGSGLRQMAKIGEVQRQQASNTGNTLANLGHQEALWEMDKSHSNRMNRTDVAGALAGGAYYGTDGFSKNPFKKKGVMNASNDNPFAVTV